MDLKGLTSKQVEERIRKGQQNKFKDASSRSILDILRTHFLYPSYVIIWLAVFMLVLYQQWTDAIFIGSVIVVNNVIGVVQELIARNSLRRVQVINTQPVHVVRDGKDLEIMPDELVKDDLIRLDSGKYIFVDGEVVSSHRLLLDESIITGESDYIERGEGEELQSGSFVISGNGFYKATRVGKDSFVNKITIETKRYINHLSPLQKYINKIVVIMTYLSLALIALLLLLNLRFLDMDKVEITRAAISIVSTMVPQGILLSITLAFMIGVYKMYQKKILVQRASAIESLANIDVLCMDKTGTLTQNKLQVKTHEVLVSKSDDVSKIADELLSIFCEYTIEKNKTLLAIADVFSISDKLRDQIDEGKSSFSAGNQLPFNSRDKLSGLEISYKDNVYRVVLASPGVVGDLLSQQQDIDGISDKSRISAETGLRNLVFMYRKLGKDESVGKWEKVERGVYRPLAFVSIQDRLRTGVNEILKDFVEKQVRPIIISGDNPETIMALIRQLKVDVLNKPITGKELQVAFEKGSGEFSEAVLGHDIFAAVSPEQKLEIVKVLQKHYHGVAMIGDGVNDALAIKQANLGISMSEGANVSRNISDIVLLDNNMLRLSQVIQEGKDIVYNTLRASRILTAKNFYSLVIIFMTLVLGVTFPFTPRNTFLLAFINANFFALEFLSDTGAHYRGVNFMKNLLSFSIVSGFISGLMSTGVLLYYEKVGGHTSTFVSTIVLSFLMLVALANYLATVEFDFNVFNIKWNIKKIGALSITFGVYLVCMYFSYSAELFELEKIYLFDWIKLIFVVVIYYLLLWLIYGQIEKRTGSGLER